MKIEFSLDDNDFLIHQLYTASKSERIRKKRQRSRALLPILYQILGLLFLIQNRYTPCIAFMGISLLWYFIYPLWEKRHYVQHYSNFIKDNYKDRLGKMNRVELSPDFIFTTDGVSESKIACSELEEIVEIPNLALLRLKGAQSLILPKEKISNFEALRQHLQTMATALNIQYSNEHDWKWQ